MLQSFIRCHGNRGPNQYLNVYRVCSDRLRSSFTCTPPRGRFTLLLPVCVTSSCRGSKIKSILKLRKWSVETLWWRSGFIRRTALDLDYVDQNQAVGSVSHSAIHTHTHSSVEVLYVVFRIARVFYLSVMSHNWNWWCHALLVVAEVSNCALQRKREATDSDVETTTTPSTPSADDLKKGKKKKREKKAKLEEAEPEGEGVEPETEVS